MSGKRIPFSLQVFRSEESKDPMVKIEVLYESRLKGYVDQEKQRYVKTRGVILRCFLGERKLWGVITNSREWTEEID